MPNTNKLKKKIRNKTAKIGVIGMGYVGLPLAMEFTLKNFVTVGFDIDSEKIARLKRGQSYIKYIPAKQIGRLVKNGHLIPEDDFSKLRICDCVIICVPTPLEENKEPDLSFVISSTGQIAKCLRAGQLVVLESTTYPGTTREVVLPILEKTGLKEGKDFYLAFSPERVDPGNTKFKFHQVPKVVGGISNKSTELGELLYRQVTKKVISVSSTEVAESTKMLENTFRAVNIALVNELKILFEKMGINVWDVIQASSTKPYGFMPFYPGPGWGGHCIPIDPFYLSWRAGKYGVDARFIELAGEINTNMPHYVISKVEEGLNRYNRNLKNSKILILGVAYKSDVDDIRESPSVCLIEILKEKGADVIYNDPYIPNISGMRQHKVVMVSVKLNKKVLSEVDCVLIATAHSSYDYKWILRNAKLVVDTRNALKDIKDTKKLIRA
jgi:UDP-N-acetyl-D-glucosamine dehydrogenase